MRMGARETPIVTERGILVPLGHFVEQVGLLDALERLPSALKTVVHSPGDKLADLLCHVCGSGIYVTELGRSAHPLRDDPAVAAAWKQDAFTSASGVNALLGKTTPQTVAAVRTELSAVLAPFRQRVLRLVMAAWIVVDLDLMALVVSDPATTNIRSTRSRPTAWRNWSGSSRPRWAIRVVGSKHSPQAWPPCRRRSQPSKPN